MRNPAAYSRLPRIGQYKWTAVPGDADHFGWLALREQPRVVKRADYPRLFAAIGETYGAGDGSTTFCLPPLGGRTAIGASAAHPVGKIGGAETVQLTVAQMPAHKHGASKVTTANTSPQKALLTGVGLGDITKPPTTSVASTGADTTEAGSSEAHPNMPPFIAASVFIFAGM